MKRIPLLTLLLAFGGLTSSQALTIRGDRQIFDMERQVITVKGHVQVDLEESTLTANQLIYKKKEEKLQATGQVKYQSKELQVEAHSLTFLRKEGKIQLSSHFSMHQKDMQITGSRGFVFPKEKRGSAEEATVEKPKILIHAQTLTFSGDLIQGKGNVSLSLEEGKETYRATAQDLAYDSQVKTLTLTKASFHTDKLRISSHRAIIVEEREATFEGEVQVTKENQQIAAQKAVYSFAEHRLLLKGNVRLREEHAPHP